MDNLDHLVREPLLTPDHEGALPDESPAYLAIGLGDRANDWAFHIDALAREVEALRDRHSASVPRVASAYVREAAANLRRAADELELARRRLAREAANAQAEEDILARAAKGAGS